MKHRFPALLAVAALTLSGCAAEPDAPAPLPTLTSSSPAEVPAPPADPEPEPEQVGGTAEQQAIALEAAKIMSTWTPSKDDTRTDAELRARHLMTAERAAKVVAPERPAGGAEWIEAAQEDATSVPAATLNDRADSPGVAVRVTWSWQRPDGSALPRPNIPLRYYTFTFSDTEPTKISDYSYIDRTTVGTPTS